MRSPRQLRLSNFDEAIKSALFQSCAHPGITHSNYQLRRIHVTNKRERPSTFIYHDGQGNPDCAVFICQLCSCFAFRGSGHQRLQREKERRPLRYPILARHQYFELLHLPGSESILMSVYRDRSPLTKIACLSLQGILVCPLIPGAVECDGKKEDDPCRFLGSEARDGKCRTDARVSRFNAAFSRELRQLTMILPSI